jgi:hypothetical protein
VRRVFALLAATLCLSGCGYALVGRGVNVDASIKRIGVPLFKDWTGKPGLDQRITEAVTGELLKRHRFEIVPDSTGVDAVIDGEIMSYIVRPAGYSNANAGTTATTATTEATRYDITLTAKVRYRKLGTPEPLWENAAFSYSDQYDLGSDPGGLFDREDQSLERLSKTFARNLVSAILEAF